MGLVGANLYNCIGYRSPIHSDRDAEGVISLTVQLEKVVNDDLHEFDFVVLEFGYYIVTEPNMLW